MATNNGTCKGREGSWWAEGKVRVDGTGLKRGLAGALLGKTLAQQGNADCPFLGAGVGRASVGCLGQILVG